MIILSLYLEKYVRISKFLLGIFCISQIFGQTTHIILGNKDTLTVNHYQDIQVEVQSLLKSSDDIGKYYSLEEIKSDSIISYKQLHETVNLDTIIFTNADIHFSIQRQIFKSIEKTKPIRKTQKQFDIIKKSNPFFKNDMELSFGLYKKNKIGLIIDAKPNFNNYFSGLIGANRSDNQKWEITGQLEAHLENTWKTAGIIDLLWKRLDNESQLLNLKYEEPHPFALPIGFSLQFSQDLRDGNYVHSSSAVGVIKLIPGLGKLGFGGKNTTINSTAKGDSLGLTDLQTKTIYINGLVDYRNDYWLPSAGYYLDINGEIGSRAIGDSSSIKYSIDGKFENYFPIFKQTSLITKLYGSGSWINKGNLHDGELIRYGGATKLRGYREDIFQSDWVAIPSVELSYDIGAKQRLSLFTDFAIQSDINPIPIGYGIGYSQVTKNSVLKLYYGLERNTSLKSGKIHLQFLTIL